MFKSYEEAVRAYESMQLKIQEAEESLKLLATQYEQTLRALRELQKYSQEVRAELADEEYLTKLKKRFGEQWADPIEARTYENWALTTRLHLFGDLNVDGRLGVARRTVINGDLYVNDSHGRPIVKCEQRTGDMGDPRLEMSGRIRIGGDVRFEDRMDDYGYRQDDGPVVFDREVVFKQPVTFEQDAEFEWNARFRDDLTVAGDASVGGSIYLLEEKDGKIVRRRVGEGGEERQDVPDLQEQQTQGPGTGPGRVDRPELPEVDAEGSGGSDDG